MQRTLVVCPDTIAKSNKISFIVLFLEQLRNHKADIVIIHFDKLEKHVYELLKFYQEEGLVNIRLNGVWPSKIWHWDQRFIIQNECFYEFKEHTSFIWFPNWDELIISKKLLPLLSLPSEKFLQEHIYYINNGFLKLKKYDGFMGKLSLS